MEVVESRFWSRIFNFQNWLPPLRLRAGVVRCRQAFTKFSPHAGLLAQPLLVGVINNLKCNYNLNLSQYLNLSDMELQMKDILAACWSLGSLFQNQKKIISRARNVSKTWSTNSNTFYISCGLLQMFSARSSRTSSSRRPTENSVFSRRLTQPSWSLSNSTDSFVNLVSLQGVHSVPQSFSWVGLSSLLVCGTSVSLEQLKYTWNKLAFCFNLISLQGEECFTNWLLQISDPTKKPIKIC